MGGGVEVIVVVENGMEVSEEVIHLWYSSNRNAGGQKLYPRRECPHIVREAMVSEVKHPAFTHCDVFRPPPLSV